MTVDDEHDRVYLIGDTVIRALSTEDGREVWKWTARPPAGVADMHAPRVALAGPLMLVLYQMEALAGQRGGARVVALRVADGAVRAEVRIPGSPGPSDTPDVRDAQVVFQREEDEEVWDFGGLSAEQPGVTSAPSH